jgi:nucleotide-binding universal stress UspA family protein
MTKTGRSRRSASVPDLEDVRPSSRVREGATLAARCRGGIPMRVLLATDFSTQAQTARALVARLALPVDSSVRVVYAIEPMGVTAFASMPILDLRGQTQRELRAELERFASPLRSPDRSVEVALPVGRAPEVIVAEAERFAADLIVIGNRGRGGISSMLLGSVSAEVIDRAPCPVLVARGETLTRILLAEEGSASAAIGAKAIADLHLARTLPVHVVSVTDFPFPYPAEVEPERGRRRTALPGAAPPLAGRARAYGTRAGEFARGAWDQRVLGDARGRCGCGDHPSR